MQVDVASLVGKENVDHTSTDLPSVSPVPARIPPRPKLRCYELIALAVAFEKPTPNWYRDLGYRNHVIVRVRDDKICYGATRREEEAFCSILASQTTELRCLGSEKAGGFEVVWTKSGILLVDAAAFESPMFAVWNPARRVRAVHERRGSEASLHWPRGGESPV